MSEGVLERDPAQSGVLDNLRSGGGAFSFYKALFFRYRRLLAAVVVLMAAFSGISYLRVGAAGLLIDAFRVHEIRALGGTDVTEDAQGTVAEFERFWRSAFPPDVRPITERLGEPHGFFEFLLVLSLALVVVALALGATFYLKEYCAQRMVVGMLTDVREALFRHLTRQSVAYFHSQRCGDLISRSTNDVEVIQNSLRKICEVLLQQPLTIFMGLAVACAVQPVLFVVALPFYLLVLIPVVRAGRKVIRHGRRRQEKMGRITEALEQLFSGIRIVKAFGMESRECEAFADKNRSFARSHLKMRRARILGRSLQEVLFNLVLALLFIFTGWLLTNEVAGIHTSPGKFAIFFMALLQIYQPLRMLSKAWNEVQEARPAIERVLEILRAEPTVKDRPGAKEFPGLREAIRFENVSFQYEEAPGYRTLEGEERPRPAVLRDISLEVKAGEVVALVGPSGAGKSTLVDLLARFYDPQEGRITVDGVDIREYRHASYLKSIAIVTQEPFLFNTTIRENIRYGRPDATDEEVEEAARLANAHDFIVAQPSGYDTVIGDRGAKLSGGQRQRITIARALLKDAPILILDEATSALDSEAEREVQKALENLMARRTTFVIAHRLSTVARADKIVVLEEGRIVERGRHEELLRRRGRYWELYTSQNPEFVAQEGRR